MTKECLFCKWKLRNDGYGRFAYQCINETSNYYGMKVPANPSFTYCFGFDMKDYFAGHNEKRRNERRNIWIN